MPRNIFKRLFKVSLKISPKVSLKYIYKVSLKISLKASLKVPLRISLISSAQYCIKIVHRWHCLSQIKDWNGGRSGTAYPIWLIFKRLRPRYNKSTLAKELLRYLDSLSSYCALGPATDIDQTWRKRWFFSSIPKNETIGASHQAPWERRKMLTSSFFISWSQRNNRYFA